tara:strand:- start:233 stop:469 length:237 start_codon:yes stop_codon:yes gene_type:complete
MGKESLFGLTMAIDPEVISTSTEKGSRSGRYFPKWLIYSAGGLGVVILVSLIKALLPVIGMTFLLAFIWSQSTQTRRY